MKKFFISTTDVCSTGDNAGTCYLIANDMKVDWLIQMNYEWNIEKRGSNRHPQANDNEKTYEWKTNVKNDKRDQAHSFVFDA